MLSQIPIDATKIPEKDRDREMLRAALMEELDSINLYEQMASVTINPDIRKVLLEIASEEKMHVGEIYELLALHDSEQLSEMKKGQKETKEIIGFKHK